MPWRIGALAVSAASMRAVLASAAFIAAALIAEVM
jgi:hypothetical protein